MTLTNHAGLPAAFVRAIENDPYCRGDADYSVSDLVAPPRLVTLRRRHADKIVEDASDRVWALLGQAVHVVLERASQEGVTEKRLFAAICGKRISGQMDSLRDGMLTDYKCTSAWSRVYGSRADDWERQLNLYAWLCDQNNIEVKALEVCAIYRDWSESQAAKGGNYPQNMIEVIPIKLLSPEERHALAVERVNWLIESETTLPECSADDTWEKRDKKAGALDRPRCRRYCPVGGESDLCGQWWAWRKAQADLGVVLAAKKTRDFVKTVEGDE